VSPKIAAEHFSGAHNSMDRALIGSAGSSRLEQARRIVSAVINYER